MSESDLALWRRRFILVALVQIGGTLLGLFGLLLWQSSLIVTGGSIAGFALALIGLVISFFGPRTLTRRWKVRDGR
jgi:hypothetical protein